MRKLAVVLLILVATAAFAARTDYTGNYKGPDASYGLVIENSNGRLHGRYVESGRLAVLSPIEIKGAAFTATASFDNGTYRTITGTFTERGAIVEGTLFERF